MKEVKIKCDIKGCKNKAAHEQIDCCTGWLEETSGSNIPTTKYKPFEKPTFGKKDLCEKHFKIWCEATYKAFYKIKK